MTNETYSPWWGDRAVADAERERQARQEDKREAEEFQAKLDRVETIPEQRRRENAAREAWTPDSDLRQAVEWRHELDYSGIAPYTEGTAAGRAASLPRRHEGEWTSGNWEDEG